MSVSNVCRRARRARRTLLGIGAAIALVGGGMCVVGQSTPPAAAPAKLSLKTLRARYHLPNSRFATLDQVPVHFTDEGRGPSVVLLHASYLDLTSWDDWARNLTRDHRVLRLDRLRFGMTGSYPGNVVDYEHEVKLLEAFVADRKLHHFTLVGASSGGMVAALYAQRHPEMLDTLVLMNFPIGHGRIANAVKPAAPGGAALIRLILETNMIDKRPITPALVQRLGDFADREDEGGAAAASFDKASALTEDDRIRILRGIRTRTMVLWSAENRTLPMTAGQAAFDAIGAPHKYLTIIGGAGHMVPLERGRETAQVVRQFIDGGAAPARVGP